MCVVHIESYLNFSVTFSEVMMSVSADAAEIFGDGAQIACPHPW